VKAQTLKLGEICEINPSTQYDFDPDDACSFVPMEAVDDVDACIARMAIRPFREVARGYTPFAENDVIVAKITPCMENGKCAIGQRLRSGIAFGSTEFHVLRATKRVLPEWLFYFWRFPPTRKLASLNMIGSAGQKRVPASFLETADIPLPDISEQMRIAGRLKQADRLCRTRRYAVALTDTFLPAAFLELFGDRSFPHVTLEELATDDRNSFVNGPFGSDLLTSELTDSGVPVIYIRDISSGRYERTSSVFVTPAKAANLEFCSAKPGDVLVTKVGDPPGIAAIYPAWAAEGVVTQDVIRIRPNTELVSAFYMQGFLNSRLAHHEMSKIMVESTRLRFSLGQFKEISVPLPPLPLQQKFAGLVERVERLRAVQREALRQAEHLFADLLHRAFSG
jgi:type I restriction enzyme, S subunit